MGESPFPEGHAAGRSSQPRQVALEMDVVDPLRHLLAFSVPHVFDQEDANAEDCQKCKDEELCDEMPVSAAARPRSQPTLANPTDPNDPRR